jgi:hypothetical protein
MHGKIISLSIYSKVIYPKKKKKIYSKVKCYPKKKKIYSKVKTNNSINTIKLKIGQVGKLLMVDNKVV